MIDPKGILMVEPSDKISAEPLIDELTRKMTAAWRVRTGDGTSYRGWHTCACGAWSDNKDHFVGPAALLTNSLCIHYLAYHRDDIPETELVKVRALPHEGQDPTAKELQKPSRHR